MEIAAQYLRHSIKLGKYCEADAGHFHFAISRLELGPDSSSLLLLFVTILTA
jgi:hypothetical protein